MKAIFINAEEQKIEKIDFDGDYRKIQDKIGCRCFTCVYLDTGNDAIFIDDEGLLTLDANSKFFFMKGRNYAQPFAGNGLILGADEEGESTDAACFDSFDESSIAFMDMREVQLRSKLGQWE